MHESPQHTKTIMAEIKQSISGNSVKKRIVGMLPTFRILLEFSVFQRLQFQKVHKMSS